MVSHCTAHLIPLHYGSEPLLREPPGLLVTILQCLRFMRPQCIALPSFKLNLILLFPVCISYLSGIIFIMVYSSLTLRTFPNFAFSVQFIRVMGTPFSMSLIKQLNEIKPHYWPSWFLREPPPGTSNTMCHLGLFNPFFSLSRASHPVQSSHGTGNWRYRISDFAFPFAFVQEKWHWQVHLLWQILDNKPSMTSLSSRESRTFILHFHLTVLCRVISATLVHQEHPPPKPTHIWSPDTSQLILPHSSKSPISTIV
jgi:hypothetical protein